jgi:molybdenum cofactor cytidylyltransferase
MSSLFPNSGIEGVILAAGSSARAGTFKPALDLGGKPMIGRCLEGMLQVCSRVVVVGGFALERLRDLVREIPGVVCVENPDYRNGMFTSVKVGLSHVRGEACFVLPVDTPLVPAGVYRSLAASNALIAVPTFRGVRGHPLFLKASLIPAILGEPDTSSLREFIRRTGPTLITVDSDSVLLDIDTHQDYERAVLQLKGDM